VVGLLNATLVAIIKVAPLIATLGTMTMLRGVAYIISGGLPVFGFSDTFSFLGQGYVWIIPVPVIIMIIAFIFGYIVLEKTKFGRYIYGIGSNEEAARLSGVNVTKIRFITYVIAGCLFALSGLVLLSRVNSGQPIAGKEYEMSIVTGCVLGGVSINGGEGKITSVVIGTLIMGVLLNGMIMVNLPEYYQWVVKGFVMLLAVSYDTLMKRRSKVA